VTSVKNSVAGSLPRCREQSRLLPPPQSAGKSGTQHVAIDWLGGDDDSAEYQRDTTARPTGDPANDTDCVAIFVVAASASETRKDKFPYIVLA
jgi:hypothetical protein